jgi:hypothetical protein
LFLCDKTVSQPDNLKTIFFRNTLPP